jgi:hypothetical protein
VPLNVGREPQNWSIQSKNGQLSTCLLVTLERAIDRRANRTGPKKRFNKKARQPSQGRRGFFYSYFEEFDCV